MGRQYARIIGTGAAQGARELTNQDLEKIVDTTDAWIFRRVGIRKRFIVEEGQTTNTLAVQAACQAVENAGIDPQEIGLIIVGTTTADYLFPSTACIVQKELGITNECPAFDLNAACSGFIYGLSVADQYIRNGKRYAVVVGVDSLSRIVDWTDRSTCVLFGDAAGAVVLEASDKPGILHTKIMSDGSSFNLLKARNRFDDSFSAQGAALEMEGNAVFRAAVSKLSEVVRQSLKELELSGEDIDWLIPHQANSRIIKATAEHVGIPLEKVVLTIEEQGNTSAASVPLALHQALSSKLIKPNQLVMLEAFGAGFAWGSALVRF